MYSDVFYNMFYLSTCSVNVLDTNVFLCNFEARSQVRNEGGGKVVASRGRIEMRYINFGKESVEARKEYN